MNLEDDNLIEGFLNNNLSKEETKAFLKRMESDPDFKEQVLLERELYNSLNEEEWSFIEERNSEEVKAYETLLASKELKGLKEVISKTNEKYQKSGNSKFNRWILYSSAAILAMFLAIYLLLQTSTSPQQLYAESINLAELPSLVTRSDDTSNSLVKAQQLFEAANYNEALLLFSKAKQDNATIVLYKGIAEMQLDNFQAAEASFNALIESDYLDAQKGYWYKALLYLKKNDIENSKTLLKEIISNEYYNYKKAKDLLKKL